MRPEVNSNGTTFQSGFRFQTGLSSLRVLCKRALKLGLRPSVHLIYELDIDVGSGC